MPCESNNQPLCINVTLVIHCWCWLISRLFVLSLKVISKPIKAYHTCAINEVSPSSCARTSAHSLSLSLCTFHTCITDRMTLTFLCKLWVAVGFQSVVHIGNVNLTSTFMGQRLYRYPASFKIKLVGGINFWWKDEGTAPRFPPNKNKRKIKQRRRPEELSWCRLSS